ncbi:MAG: 30S ribosomal protein S8 [Omnitrophica WOR_2 bacterium SM23_29]|nr:MAG: 30S ribosomal protein S8 [Omnitrophica WOR_2 bacterium SM23_29]
MSKTDSIADMLTLIRNACRTRKDNVDVPNFKIGREILNILKREGYIADFKPLESSKINLIRVYLKYISNRSAIKNLKRLSKPGLRVYTPSKKIPRVLRGLGIAIISTSKGIMTDKEARELKVGGEILCYIW